MSARDFVRPFLGEADEFVTSEIDYWRQEATRPWREGRSGRLPEVARWIGLGLALGATVAGIAAALRAERPWES